MQAQLKTVKQDSVKIQKNEIGIDMIPIVSLLSNSNSTSSKNSIQFKRSLNKNWYLRANITAITRQDNYSNGYSQILGEKDSMVFIKYKKSVTKPEFQFNTGVEYRWGKNRIKYFVGSDIGYCFSKSDFSINYGERDKSNYYSNPDYAGTSYYGSKKDSTITSFSLKTKGIGITPFIGMQFHFSKRWFFSAQVGPQFQIMRSKQTINFDNSNTYPSMNYSIVNFDVNGFLNNFSLFYKF